VAHQFQAHVQPSLAGASECTVLRPSHAVSPALCRGLLQCLSFARAKQTRKYANKFHLTRLGGLGAHAQHSPHVTLLLLPGSPQTRKLRIGSSESAGKRFAWHLGPFPRKMRSIAFDVLQHAKAQDSRKSKSTRHQPAVLATLLITGSQAVL